MKKVICFSLLFASFSLIAQNDFPYFLKGTWKVEGQELYERWDLLHEKSLKGISYKMENGLLSIKEYLEIMDADKGVTYRATVIGQNNGEAVDFVLRKKGSEFSFENPDHDFPKKISYKLIAENELWVEVSGGEDKSFSFKMEKQEEPLLVNDPKVKNPNFDASLAVNLGADDYGMKSFMLVILSTGDNKTTDRVFIDSCFRGHLENIRLLVEQGKLIVAGPLGKNEQAYRGIFILDVNQLAEAHELMQSDPAITSGLLKAEFYPWYGSAALPLYLEASEKIWKIRP